MKPILFSIGGIEVHALTIFTIAGFLVFTFLLWKNLRGLVKKNTVFDIIIFTLLLSPLIGRIVYLSKHFMSYLDRGWSVLPIRDTAVGVAYFDAMPWNLFAIWDGGIYVHFMPIAVFLAVYFSLVLSREKIFYRKVIARVWISLMPAYLFFLLGYLLDGSYVGKPGAIPLKVLYEGENEARLAVQIIEIVLVMGIAIFYLDVKENNTIIKKSRFLLFPAAWAVGQILLWFEVEQYSKDLFIFDTVQIAWGIGLIIFLLMAGVYKTGTKPKSSKASMSFNRGKYSYMKNRAWLGRQRGEKVNGTETMTRTNENPKQPEPNDTARGDGQYSRSFSSYKKDFSTDLSFSEKVKKTRNRLKRGL